MSNPRILIIEDNPADIRLLKQALDQQGQSYALQVLTDGEAAIRYLEEHCIGGNDPCLIVVDLHLPRYDGLAVLRALRAKSALAHVEVAVLTTVASPDEEAQVFELGVSLYARKPANWDDFVKLGGELMKLCRGTLARAAAPPV